MPNNFLANQKNNNPWVASCWRNQVQWRSLSAGLALITVLISAPLSRRHTVEFKSSDADSVGAGSTGIIADEVDVGSATEAVRAAPVMGSAPTTDGLTPAHRRLKTDAISHSAINSRCSELLARSELGEPLSEQNRAFLLKECQ